MTKPLVSMTLAAYNVEPFLADALDCILGQTYSNLEIICINDGSSDSTGAILDTYAQKDTRVRAIHKTKNEGLAVARNLSLAEAQGKYIMFVDGDDLMDTRLVERAVTSLEWYQSDVVVWDYKIFYKDSELTGLNSQSPDLERIDTEDTVGLLKRPSFTWVKMFRTEALRNLGIYFPQGLTRQDIPVHWHIFTSDLKRSILPEVLSYYRQQPDATTAQKGRKLLDIAQVMLEVKKVLDQTNQYAKFKETYLEQQLNMLHGMYENIKDDLKSDALDLILSQIGEDQEAYIHSQLPLRKQARWFYKAHEGNIIAKGKLALRNGIRFAYRQIK